jgi:hypothetical protein
LTLVRHELTKYTPGDNTVNTVKRRAALATGFAAATLTAGCLSAVAEPDVRRAYSFDREQPFFDGQMLLSEDGVDATLAASDDAIEALHWELFEDTQEEPYRSANPPQTFLTVACAPLDQARERLDDVDAVLESDGTFRLQYRIAPKYGGAETKRKFGYELVKWESRGLVPDRVIVEQLPEPDPRE